MVRALLVDDDATIRTSFARALARHGIQATGAESLVVARALLEATPFEIAIVDLRLCEATNDRSGLELVRECRTGGGPPVIVLTGTRDAFVVREAHRAGCTELFFKGELGLDVLASTVLRLARRPQQPPSHAAFRNLIESSAVMVGLREKILRIAAREHPVLITGENGSGKEPVARALHELSPRSAEPFEAINACELPHALFESSLFGHVRGAFTDAKTDALGAFERSQGGTLFLDEIGDLPMELQPKLLRAIETRRIRRVGASTDREFRARLVCATNAPLAERVETGKFRLDLLHRLNVHELRVPSLDERQEDVPDLIAHFAAREGIVIDASATAWLSARRYPGNVRELRNVVIRIAALGSPHVGVTDARRALDEDASPALSLRSRTRDVEEHAIRTAMQATNGNKSAAARLLGMTRWALLRRLHRHEFCPPLRPAGQR